VAAKPNSAIAADLATVRPAPLRDFPLFSMLKSPPDPNRFLVSQDSVFGQVRVSISEALSCLRASSPEVVPDVLGEAEAWDGPEARDAQEAEAQDARQAARGVLPVQDALPAVAQGAFQVLAVALAVVPDEPRVKAAALVAEQGAAVLVARDVVQEQAAAVAAAPDAFRVQVATLAVAPGVVQEQAALRAQVAWGLAERNGSLARIFGPPLAGA